MSELSMVTWSTHDAMLRLSEIGPKYMNGAEYRNSAPVVIDREIPAGMETTT